MKLRTTKIILLRIARMEIGSDIDKFKMQIDIREQQKEAETKNLLIFYINMLCYSSVNTEFQI